MGSQDKGRQSNHKPNTAWSPLGASAPSARAMRIKRAQAKSGAGAVMKALDDRGDRDAADRTVSQQSSGLLARFRRMGLLGGFGRPSQDPFQDMFNVADERVQQELREHRTSVSRWHHRDKPLQAKWLKPIEPEKPVVIQGVPGAIQALAEDASALDPREFKWLATLSDKMAFIRDKLIDDDDATLSWMQVEATLQAIIAQDRLHLAAQDTAGLYQGLQSQWQHLIDYLDCDEDDPLRAEVDDLVGKIAGLAEDSTLDDTLTSPRLGG